MGRLATMREVIKVTGGYVAPTGAAAAMIKACVITGHPWLAAGLYLPAVMTTYAVICKLVSGPHDHLDLGQKLNGAIKKAGGYAQLQASVRTPQGMTTSELVGLCATDSQCRTARRTFEKAPDTYLRKFLDHLFLDENDPKKVLDDLRWARDEVFSALDGWQDCFRYNSAMRDAMSALAMRRQARAEAENRSFPRRLVSALTFS